MIPGSAHALMLGGDPCEVYQIGHSVRFNPADSPSLTRTPGVASNRTTWTFSCWLKLTGMDPSKVYGIFVNHGDASSYRDFVEIQANQIRFDLNSSASTFAGQLKTTALFRDPSSHFHVVAVLDTTNAVAADRMRIFVNGVRITTFAAQTNPPQNSLSWTNASGIVHRIGVDPFAGLNQPMDGYLSDIHFIDGQALAASDFGFFCPSTGQWRPKKYAGTYGVNGFHLDFSDGSAATAAALGKDRSGNNNDWTPTNLSMTAGAGFDWLEDSPTNNFPTFNPLKLYTANLALTNGLLDASDSSSAVVTARATINVPASGKWYFEVLNNSVPAAGSNFIGVAPPAPADGNTPFSAYGSYRSNGSIFNLAGLAQTAGAAYANGDVVGVAVDQSAGTVQFYKNGVAQGGVPSFSFTAGNELVPFVAGDNVAGTKSYSANFGQRPFSYTPPAGFKALCTKNLQKSGVVTVSGSFTGSANADGPFVWMNGTPATLTINGNAVTFGTHADALANGFKVRTSSASYNAAGTNTWTATIVSNYRSIFRHQNAKGN